MRFGASEYVEAIDNIFAIDEAQEKLVWNNEAFSDGTARFCADLTGALYGVFSGPLPGNCTATELRVQNRELRRDSGHQSFALYLLTTIFVPR